MKIKVFQEKEAGCWLWVLRISWRTPHSPGPKVFTASQSGNESERAQ